jgi:hypothetical protein
MMRRITQILTVVVVLAVIYEELRKGPDGQKWHGRALGFVPYDLRPPSLRQIKETYWNPKDRRIFTGKVAGIGWGINFAALFDRISRM